jgi:hypothetical protein
MDARIVHTQHDEILVEARDSIEDQVQAIVKESRPCHCSRGHCWAKFSNILKDGIKKSRYPKLIEEPGRVLGILFFM